MSWILEDPFSRKVEGKRKLHKEWHLEEGMKPRDFQRTTHYVLYCHYVRKTGCVIRIEAGYWRALTVEDTTFLKVFTRKWYTSNASKWIYLSSKEKHFTVKFSAQCFSGEILNALLLLATIFFYTTLINNNFWTLETDFW